LGTIVAPTILSSCKKNANSRVQLAHIGVGSRGSQTAKDYFFKIPDSRSLATCDAFTDRREDLAKEIMTFYKKSYDEDIACTPYLNYQELLEREDIDAVHIATGDHWHLPMAIHAARAGKHIYLEKPLGLSLEYMLELEKIMKEKDLIFHYGTQQRSLEHIRKGTEMVKSEEIGKIEKIEIWAPTYTNQVDGSIITKNPPANLDYDRWLGPAPVKPYCDARITSQGIYNIYDYALGYISIWGAHPLDVAVWGAKQQMLDIAAFTGTGTLYPEQSIYDTIQYWDLNINYPNGFEIHFVSGNLAGKMKKKLDSGDGTTFYGSKGWISLGRGAAASNNTKLHEELNKTVLGENRLHGLNFIKAIKGEINPLCPLDEAILSDSISHMGNILIRSGKNKIVWDTINREIINYPYLKEKFFHRELREPYTL